MSGKMGLFLNGRKDQSASSFDEGIGEARVRTREAYFNPVKTGSKRIRRATVF